MAGFKVRRQLLAQGGLTVGGTTLGTGGGLTTGSLNVSSGSTTIGASGIAIGTYGSKISNLMFGSVIIPVPQITASGPVVEVNSPVIAGIPNGAKVFLIAASNPAGVSAVICTQARAVSGSVISGSFATADHSATGGACNVTFNYVAWS